MLLGPIPWASWWAGEISLDGTRRFDPGTPDRDAVSRIDFERVHAELWPTWLAAVGPAREVAWEELQRSVQDDSFLVARLETIHRLIQKGPARNANRLLYQVWAWNHYLDLLGAPRSQVSFVADRPGHDWRYAVETTRARDELGWRPEREFDAAFAETVRWYVEHADWWRPLRAADDA